MRETQPVSNLVVDRILLVLHHVALESHRTPSPARGVDHHPVICWPPAGRVKGNLEAAEPPGGLLGGEADPQGRRPAVIDALQAVATAADPALRVLQRAVHGGSEARRTSLDVDPILDLDGVSEQPARPERSAGAGN